MEIDIVHRMVNLLRLAELSFKRSFEKKVADTGLYRGQRRLLMVLSRHPNCSQAELAEIMDISPAAVTVSLKKLEKAGYICRQSLEKDNRMNQLIVTVKGEEAVDESTQFFREVETAFAKGFSHEEMDQMEDFLLRIVANQEEYCQSIVEEKKQQRNENRKEVIEK